MIGTILAAWVAASIPTALFVGHTIRKAREMSHHPFTPQPLNRAELGRIVALFDTAALVRGEPDAGGYVEITFTEEMEAQRFVAVAHRGKWGAVPFAQDVGGPLHAVGGPVTLGVTLLPAWRPAREVAA